MSLLPGPILRLAAIVILVLYWLNVFFIIYHLVRFGIGTKPKIIALVFFIGSMFLFADLVVSISQADLTAVLNNINWPAGWRIYPVIPTPIY